MTPDEQASFASEVYLRAKEIWTGAFVARRRTSALNGDAMSTPFSSGRDPKPLGDILHIANVDMGWSVEIEQAKLISEWPRLVGESTAPHTQVIELRDGVLIVQCDSTAWATELRRMRTQILTQIIENFPGAEIDDLRFLAPGAPTWRHGSRVVPGRGPRDTYG